MINTKATTDRRLAIRDYISDHRITSIPELMREFEISRSTVMRDLDAISEITSFYSLPGNGGGIYATEGWYSSRRYLTEQQKKLLVGLLSQLQSEEDVKTMKTILAAFSGPTQIS